MIRVDVIILDNPVFNLVLTAYAILAAFRIAKFIVEIIL